MPVQSGKSNLLAKLGQKARAAWDAHRGDEVRFGIVNLPPGISGGVAQLVTAKWDEYKVGTKYAGKPYVLLRGIALRPAEHRGVPVRGQGVMLTIPLCDTPDRKCNGQPGTMENWLAELMNEFRKLGIEIGDDSSPDDIEAFLAALQEEKPHFRFSTRGWTPPATPQSPNPDEMVFTQFDGRCDAPDEESSAASGVQDQTGQRTSRNGPATSAGRPVPKTAPAETSADEFNEFGDSSEPDLDALAEDAANGDDEAIAQLTELAVAAGRSEEDVGNALKWETVVEWIRAASEGGEEAPEGEEEPAAEEEEEPWEPKKTDIYLYKPLDPKTKRPVKKAIECEVTAVDKKTNTVQLKNLDNPKLVYKNVKWDDLEGDE